MKHEGLGHPSEMSSITTQANNQFPRPDLHRLDKQPYRLQTKDTKGSQIEKLRDLRDLRGNKKYKIYEPIAPAEGSL